jgi:hypothetical protein
MTEGDNMKFRQSIGWIVIPLVVAAAILGAMYFWPASLTGSSSKFEEPNLNDLGGWLEYKFGNVPDEGVRAVAVGSPNVDMLLDAFNFHARYSTHRTPDGKFRAYHFNGPFKAVLAVEADLKRGRLDGVATFWNERGKLRKQQVFREDILRDTRTSAPWLGSVTDQSLPDGVYTFTMPSSGYAKWQTVVEQEVNKRGQKVKTISIGGQWEAVGEGFWKCLINRLVCFPTQSGCEWFLDRRRVVAGNKLLIMGDTLGVLHIDTDPVNKLDARLRFTNIEGRNLDLGGGWSGAIYSWPESKRR